MFKFLLFSSLLISVKPLDDVSKQCSNYDFKLINYTYNTRNNIVYNDNYNLIYIKTMEDNIRETIEYYLRYIVENKRQIIEKIWLNTSLVLFVGCYIYLLNLIDLDTLNEYFRVLDD